MEQMIIFHGLCSRKNRYRVDGNGGRPRRTRRRHPDRAYLGLVLLAVVASATATMSAPPAHQASRITATNS